MKKVYSFVLFCLLLTANAFSAETVADTISGGVVYYSSSSATAGEVVTITVVPDSGYSTYSVDILIIDSDTTAVAATDNGDSTYSFVMPSSPITVSVTFKPTALMAVKSSLTLGSSVVRASGSQLRVSTNKAQKVQIFGANGALVKTQNVPAGETFISGLPSGVYMVKLSDGTKTSIKIR